MRDLVCRPIEILTLSMSLEELITPSYIISTSSRTDEWLDLRSEMGDR